MILVFIINFLIWEMFVFNFPRNFHNKAALHSGSDNLFEFVKTCNSPLISFYFKYLQVKTPTVSIEILTIDSFIDS